MAPKPKAPTKRKAVSEKGKSNSAKPKKKKTQSNEPVDAVIMAVASSVAAPTPSLFEQRFTQTISAMSNTERHQATPSASRIRQSNLDRYNRSIETIQPNRPVNASAIQSSNSLSDSSSRPSYQSNDPIRQPNESSSVSGTSNQSNSSINQSITLPSDQSNRSVNQSINSSSSQSNTIKKSSGIQMKIAFGFSLERPSVHQQYINHAVDFVRSRDRGEYNNWLADPTKFQLIQETLKKLGFSWRKTRLALMKEYPTLGFEKLAETTMQSWYDRKDGAYALKPTVEMRSKHLELPEFGSGRKSLMMRCKKAVDIAICTVDSMRVSGSPINSLIALPIITAVFRVHAPNEYVKLNINQRFVRRFLRQYCGFSYRRVTAARKSLPDNAKEQVAHFIRRCAALVHLHKIRPEMVLNFDQTGIRLAPSASYTYDEMGSDRASVNAHDDRRQITAVLSSTLSLDLLSIQLIFNGTTPRCLPNDERLGPGFARQLEEEGWHLTFSDNHWSNQTTMVQFIEKVSVHQLSHYRLSDLQSHSRMTFLCLFVH